VKGRKAPALCLSPSFWGSFFPSSVLARPAAGAGQNSIVVRNSAARHGRNSLFFLFFLKFFFSFPSPEEDIVEVGRGNRKARAAASSVLPFSPFFFLERVLFFLFLPSRPTSRRRKR